MHGGTQTIRFLGVQHVSTGGVKAAKQVGLRCSQGFARSTGDVRQPGRLVSGGYPGRRSPRRAGKIDDAISKRGKRENI